MTTVDYEHVSWCTGEHDCDGECLVERKVGEDATVGLQAVPCSHVNLWVDGAVYDVDGLDRLIEQIRELRPLLAAADGEAACDGHDHSDEADWSGPATEDTDEDTDDDEAADVAADGT